MRAHLASMARSELPLPLLPLGTVRESLLCILHCTQLSVLPRSLSACCAAPASCCLVRDHVCICQAAYLLGKALLALQASVHLQSGPCSRTHMMALQGTRCGAVTLGHSGTRMLVRRSASAKS